MQILNEALAKDSLKVYFREWVIEEGDAGSFQALDENYAKDKNRVYYCREYRDGQSYYLTKKVEITVLEKAQTANFQSLGNGYAKDNQNAFYKGVSFKVRDISSLKVISQPLKSIQQFDC